MDYRLKDLTGQIIKIFYNVYHELGYVFLEKEVGEYYPDLLVNNSVIIKLKAAESICEEHENQLINYLKATNI